MIEGNQEANALSFNIAIFAIDFFAKQVEHSLLGLRCLFVLRKEKRSPAIGAEVSTRPLQSREQHFFFNQKSKSGFGIVNTANAGSRNIAAGQIARTNKHLAEFTPIDKPNIFLGSQTICVGGVGSWGN